MSIRIGMGVAGFQFSSPDAFFRWVDLCEGSQVDSIWFSERLVSTAPTLEPMVAMAAVAGRTRRLKFGMNAIVLPFRDPLVLAKECATLDFLSGGRLLPAFGVGGETAPEFHATGRQAEGRGSYSDEMLDVMTRLWTEENVTYRGKHFQYEGVSIAPRPVQRPLPCWIGGSSPAAIRRTAKLGTGWLGGIQTPAQCAPVVAAIKKAAVEAGRTIDDDHYGAGFTFRFGTWEEPIVERAATQFGRIPGLGDPRAYLAVGNSRDIARRAGEYVEAGISKFVLRPIAADDADVMSQTRRLIDEVIPLVHS
jgi:probable F420-dependent oxidoreductase